MITIVNCVWGQKFSGQTGRSLESLPVNWSKGDKGITATPDGVAAYLSENASNF